MKINKHPPELYEKIVELWNKPMTSEDIAMILGMSRGSVIDIVNRAKKKGYPVSEHGRLVTLGTYSMLEARVEPPKPVSVGVLNKPVRPILKLVKKQMEPAIRRNDVAIYELDKDGCKYPTLTASDCAHKFCNKPATGPYCAAHANLTYQPRMGKVPFVKWSSK